MKNAYDEKISNRTTPKLFWGRFPFMVQTIFPGYKYRREYDKSIYFYFTKDRRSSRPEQFSSYRMEKAITNFERACLQYKPADPNTWKYKKSFSSLKFWFLHEEDFNRFVDKNKKRIESVYRPSDAIDLQSVSKIPNASVRSRLYYNRYPICIQFKYMNPERNAELDRWVMEVFGDDIKRCHLSKAIRRRFYVCSENDVFMTRLAFSKDISCVTKAILRKNNNNEPTACEKTD